MKALFLTYVDVCCCLGVGMCRCRQRPGKDAACLGDRDTHTVVAVGTHLTHGSYLLIHLCRTPPAPAYNFYSQTRADCFSGTHCSRSATHAVLRTTRPSMLWQLPHLSWSCPSPGLSPAQCINFHPVPLTPRLPSAHRAFV